MSNPPLIQGIFPIIGSGNSGVLTNVNQKGVRVGINITVLTAGSLTVTIQGIDPGVPGTPYTILASAALASTAYTPLLVYPGCIGATNSVANAPLPYQWQISWTLVTGPLAATISYCTEN